jgi:hypothetical protein
MLASDGELRFVRLARGPPGRTGAGTACELVASGMREVSMDELKAGGEPMPGMGEPAAGIEVVAGRGQGGWTEAQRVHS